MNRYKKLAFNSVIFAVGNLGSKLISLLLLPLYTYFLSTGQYGTVDLVTTTLSLILPVFTLSIGDAVLRFVMDKNSNKTIVLNNALVLTICGYAVAWLLYPLFKTILPFNNYLFYFYIMLLTSSVNGSLMQFVRANGQVKTFASIGIISSFVVLTSNIILLVQFHLGVAGYLISLIAADIVSLLILFSIGGVYRFISISLTNLALLKEMIVYSIPLIPNALMWWIMGVSDRYIITFFLGVGANGLYAVANKIPSILSMINSIFFQAWQMSAIEEANSKSKSQFYTNIFNAFATVMFLGTSLLLLSLKTILHYVISPSFFSSWEFVPFLLLGVVFSSFSGFLGTNYIAAKNTVGVFRTSIYGAIVNVGANFLLIPFIGTNGASISTMLSFLVIWLFRIADTKSFVKINYNIKSIIGNLSIIFFR
ncbi:oligosaccharide flippase family protein [Sporolactobacillus vineae]|uniref:oligosaccharide flippase family protein n=1 Tax=Sporolactobacillus vineae TaxID=444463 RepID=UPI00028997A5|nr:polysaccharide biosynthesis C-terminal domain-containing protein [Sporolactobacillus vineae]